MAIPVAHADEYLKNLLAEEEDADIVAAFPQLVRYRALQESVIAIARLRPDQFAERIEIPYDAATDSYILPDTHDHLLEVVGLNIDGQIHSLKGSSSAERDRDTPCWHTDQTEEKTPQYFVWSPSAPRYVYIDGYKPDATLVVLASNLGLAVVDGVVTELPLPYSYFPELIDYALSRMYSREDTSAGDTSYYLNRFSQMMNDRLKTDQVRNPLAMSMMRSER